MRNIRYKIYETICVKVRRNQILFDVDGIIIHQVGEGTWWSMTENGIIIHQVGEGTWWSMTEMGYVHNFVRP